MRAKGSVNDVNQTLDRGQEQAFTRLYAQYFKKLLLQSDKYVNDIQLAEEIVQDVFLKIWERSEGLIQIDSIKSYLYRSVINSSINYLHKQKNVELHHQKIIEEFTEEDLDEIDKENELIVMLYGEIEKLPQKCKRIFKMSRFERMKYKEIALHLDISEKTVENHIANALKLLREAMLLNKKPKDYSSRLTMLAFLSFL